MLRSILRDPLALALAQAAVAAAAAMTVAFLARRRHLRVERDLAVALVRGFAQIAAVGSVLLLMLNGPSWVGLLALAGMVLAAAATSSRRARQVPGAFRVALLALAGGAGSVIAAMTALGVVGTAVTIFVPVGSMLVASAMNTCGLALERFRSEVTAHAREVEAALALGAAPEVSVGLHAESAFRASLGPAVDNLRSLGIVWIPGLMTGMVLSGTPPLRAAIFQFATLAMIFTSSGLTSLIATTLVRPRAFTPAQQLLLRPGAAARR